MAEKYSVLIKYKYLEYIDNADLSDADFGSLMRGIINYDKSGKQPKFKSKNLSMLFAVIKCDIDDNRKKWEERVSVNRENGKKGGRPQNNLKKPKEPNGFSDNPQGFQITQITQTNPNNPEKPKKPDSGGGSGYDLGYESGGGGNITQPPPPLEEIKKESGKHGFFVDANVARKFQSCGVDPPQLTGPNSYLEFCAETLREKYPDKNNNQLKRIFITAVKTWDDLREEYPQWKAKREEEAAKKARKAAVEKARDDPPERCGCGGTLKKHDGELFCMAEGCHKTYKFDENLLEWVLNK